MEKNTKKKVNKKETVDNKKKYSTFTLFTYIFACMSVVISIIIILISRGTFSATAGYAKFLGDTGYSIYNNGHYTAPVNDQCAIDEYGYLDPDCAYLIACVCREWSTTKSGRWPNNCVSVGSTDEDKKCICNDAEGVRCQSTALANNAIFTTKFTNGATYYCVYGTSYASTCDVAAPTNSCYECTVTGGKQYVETINATRAASYTGGSSCHTVADSYCNPTPTPTSTPKPTTTPTSTPTPSPTPTSTPTPTATPTSTPTAGTSCYRCELGNGYEYAYTNNANAAADVTGGSKCTSVDNSKCTNHGRSCYRCTVNGGKRTGYYNTVIEAKTNTGSNSCTIVPDSECEEAPIINPPTGINKTTIVCFIIAAIGLIYASVSLIKSE